MKKLLLSLAVFCGLTSHAQLADNSLAPNFTVTAYQPWLSAAGLDNNGTYTLYDYLDRGYTVILDVSATWCPPCFSYHDAHILDQLWENYGVAGQPGVSANTQNRVLVLWVDADPSTADVTMLDGSGTPGNWVNTGYTLGQMPPNGTSGNVMFPMANPGSTVANQIGNGYNINYYPTLYIIAPNRRIKEIGQLSYSTLVAELSYGNQNQINDGDAALVSYNGSSTVCEDTYTPSAIVGNGGSTTLTNVAVNFTRNGQVLSTGTVASIAPFGEATVVGSAINNFTAGQIVAEVVVNDDAVASNNTVTHTVQDAALVNTPTVVVNLTTDRYASETSWNIRNVTTDQIVASSPIFTNLSSNGQTVQAPVTVQLQPNQCYEFTILDSYSDGLCCSYGNGTFNVQDGNGTVFIPYTSFNDKLVRGFKTASVLGVESGLTVEAINVFPNPATDRINVSFGELKGDYAVELMDLQGRVIFTDSKVDASSSFGISTEGLSSGSYIVTIKGQGNTVTKNVIVK